MSLDADDRVVDDDGERERPARRGPSALNVCPSRYEHERRPPAARAGSRRARSSAARQLKSRPSRPSSSRTAPISDASGEVVDRRRRCRSRAGRPSVSTLEPGEARAASASSASSTPRSRRACRRPGTSRRPGSRPRRAARSTTASPMSGWWSSTTSATSPSVQRRVARRLVDRDLREVLGVADRAGVLHAEALVGRVDEAAGARRRRLEEGQRRDPQRVAGGLMTCSRVTSLSRSRSGSTCTWSWRSRWPQIDDVRHARHAQQPRAGSSSGPARDLDRRQLLRRRATIIMHPARRRQRLEHLRRLATRSAARAAWVRRSCTTWRARKRSVPGSKTITIDDRPGPTATGSCRARPTPLSRSGSSGTVISCSTSSADRPSASVWTSTFGGVNSGSVSTSRPAAARRRSHDQAAGDNDADPPSGSNRRSSASCAGEPLVTARRESMNPKPATLSLHGCLSVPSATNRSERRSCGNTD